MNVKICRDCSKENGLYLKFDAEIIPCFVCGIERICFCIVWEMPFNYEVRGGHICKKCIKYNEMYNCHLVKSLDHFCTKWGNRLK